MSSTPDSNPRIIKKYANRRLYDTENKQHVTLKDVRQMVVDGVDLRVIDGGSEQDITQTVLLQIIQEREQNGSTLLTRPLLSQLIPYYENPFQQMMSEYLQHSVTAFLENQRLYQSQMQHVMTDAPLEIMQEMMLQNFRNWETLVRTDKPAVDTVKAPDKSLPE